MRKLRFAWIASFLILFSAVQASAKITKAWAHDTEANVTSMVCYASHVYAGQADGTINAFSIDTGNQLWKSTIKGEGPVLLSVKADKLYALRGFSLTIFDSMTAKVLTLKSLPFTIDETSILGTSTVADRLALQHKGQTHIIDPKKGKILFTADHPLFFGPNSQVLSNRKWMDSFDEIKGIAYLVDKDNLVAVNLKTGSVLWKAQAPSKLFGAPCHYKNMVIAAGPEIIFAVFEKDGKTAWVDDRFEERKATSPYLYFVTPKNRERFYLHVEGGIMAHLHDSARRNFFYLVPDSMQVLYSAKHDAFLLYIYTEEQSDKTRSILFRLSNKTAQLYGHDDLPGKATGLFVRSGNRVYPELQPGTLFELERKECSIFDRLQISDKSFRFMDIVGHAMVVSTQENKLIGFTVK